MTLPSAAQTAAVAHPDCRGHTGSAILTGVSILDPQKLDARFTVRPDELIDDQEMAGGYTLSQTAHRRDGKNIGYAAAR